VIAIVNKKVSEPHCVIMSFENELVPVNGRIGVLQRNLSTVLTCRRPISVPVRHHESRRTLGGGRGTDVWSAVRSSTSEAWRSTSRSSRADDRPAR